jgi:hypothetical protein
MKYLISDCKWKLWSFWYKLRCKLLRGYDVSVAKLSRITPKDTIWWGSGSEISGFSKLTGLYFSIEDGACWDVDGFWLVNIWKVTDIEKVWEEIFSTSHLGYLRKYPSYENSECIYQEWVDFRTWKSAWQWKEEIEKLIET